MHSRLGPLQQGRKQEGAEKTGSSGEQDVPRLSAVLGRLGGANLLVEHDLGAQVKRVGGGLVCLGEETCHFVQHRVLKNLTHRYRHLVVVTYMCR